MTDFCIEKAKRGEKVQRLTHNAIWLDVRFVDSNSLDQVLVNCEENGYLCYSKDQSRKILRMAPKPPRKMWIQPYENIYCGRIRCTNPHPTKEEARAMAETMIGVELLGEPQEILVPGE